MLRHFESMSFYDMFIRATLTSFFSVFKRFNSVLNNYITLFFPCKVSGLKLALKEEKEKVERRRRKKEKKKKKKKRNKRKEKKDRKKKNKENRKRNK